MSARVSLASILEDLLEYVGETGDEALKAAVIRTYDVVLQETGIDFRKSTFRHTVQPRRRA